MADIPMARGVRDLMPNEALFRNDVLETIEGVFRRFGFLTIDTPYIESMDVLKAKDAIGEDNKLIFEIEKEHLGLRYDQTMSLGRYMAMHQNLPMPFKRYAIGKVWRMDEPQRLRYREFTQADADIIGGDVAQGNAEALAAAGTAYDELALPYMIAISSREVLDKVLEKFSIPNEKRTDVMRVIDKLDRYGIDGVAKMLAKHLDDETIDRIVEFIGFGGSNEKKIDYVDSTVGDASTSKELRDTLELLELYGTKGEKSIDFSIVRGLDYYTGLVAEIKYCGEAEDRASKAYEMDTIGAGGRYERLVHTLGGKELGGVGISCGIDRMLDVMDYSSSKKNTYAEVFVANVKPNNYRYALGVANALRSAEIATDINTASRNLSNQLSYASSLNYRFALIVGDSEEKEKKVKLRDMGSGNERLVPSESIADAVRDSLR